MSVFIPQSPYTGPVQAVVLDWAGTAVDYGCMGPAAVFVRVFEDFDIRVSPADARRFMGLGCPLRITPASVHILEQALY